MSCRMFEKFGKNTIASIARRVYRISSSIFSIFPIQHVNMSHGSWAPQCHRPFDSRLWIRSAGQWRHSRQWLPRKHRQSWSPTSPPTYGYKTLGTEEIVEWKDVGWMTGACYFLFKIYWITTGGMPYNSVRSTRSTHHNWSVLIQCPIEPMPRTLGSMVESRTCQAHRSPGSNSLTQLECRNRLRLEIWKRLIAHHQPERAKAAWRILTKKKAFQNGIAKICKLKRPDIYITGKIWTRFEWQWHVFKQAPGLVRLWTFHKMSINAIHICLLTHICQSAVESSGKHTT